MPAESTAPEPPRGHRDSRRKSTGIADSSVYRAWCEKSRGFVNRERYVVFQTIGRAPVESPPHPARLTPVRRMARAAVPTGGAEIAASSPAGGASSGSEACAGETAAAEASPSPQRAGRPRTFSAHCSTVLGDQCAVESFSPQRIYFACDFFSTCSLSFIRELVAIGEPSLWQGTTFDSKAVIYSEGDTGTSMYIIARGTAEVVCKGREPRELRKHDYFGEAQALGVLAERQETVLAKTSLHVLEVSCSSLTSLLRRERSEDTSLDGILAEPPAVATPSPKRRAGSSLDVATPRSPRTPRMLRCGSASQRFYAFAEERRHFEHVAGHLYQQLVRRHHPPGRAKPAAAAAGALASASASAGPEQEEEASCSAEAGGSSGSAAAAVVEEAPEPAGRRTARQGTEVVATSPRKAVAQAHKKNSAVAAATHVSGVDNPKLWRKHLQEVQTMLVEGDMSDDGAGRERFVQRLTDSVRGDMRRGFMMPADLGKVRKNLVSGSSSQTRTPVMQRSPGSSAIPSGHASRNDNTQGRRRQEAEEETPVEEEEFSGEAHLLDLRLLPPLAFMNTRQKHALLQQMQRQARAAARNQASKTAIRQRVASIVHLVGLSKMLSSRKRVPVRPASVEKFPSPPTSPSRRSQGSNRSSPIEISVLPAPLRA